MRRVSAAAAPTRAPAPKIRAIGEVDMVGGGEQSEVWVVVRWRDGGCGKREG